MKRIKVGPSGQVVVHEPTVALPEWIEYANGEVVRYWHDGDVVEWQEWGPVVTQQEMTETVIPAKDVKIGMQVMYRGSWELVRDTGYGDVMQRRLWLGDRKRPTTFRPYEPLAVRSPA